MNAYVDSSVLLRLILRQPGALREWKSIRTGVASALVEVECLRTLDRLKLRAALPDDVLAVRREAVYRIVDELHIVEPTRPVLTRAAQPLPTLVGTLDAIHLSTAQLWREESGLDLVMATHDAALGRAAVSLGMRVVGI
jgi:predicted nucleic acid-binding protein